MAGGASVVDVPLHADIRLLAQRRRRLLPSFAILNLAQDAAQNSALRLPAVMSQRSDAPRVAQPMGGASFSHSTGTQEMLPSIAPIRGRDRQPVHASGLTPRPTDGVQAGQQENAAVANAKTNEVSELDLHDALNDFFFRQSCLPPSTGAGFDPRLTPAWAGVKR